MSDLRWHFPYHQLVCFTFANEPLLENLYSIFIMPYNIQMEEHLFDNAVRCYIVSEIRGNDRMIDIYMMQDGSIDKSLIGLSVRESLTTYLRIVFTSV